MTVSPRVSLYWTNGGDATTRWATPRKVLGGFSRDMAIHIQNLEPAFLPFSFIDHMPWGSNDPDALELDSWHMCRADPQWARLADEQEFIHNHLMLYETSVYHGVPCTIEVYLGAPENSTYLTKSWLNNRTQWANRVDSSIRPILKLRDRGVPVRIWIDGAGARDNASQSCAVYTRYRARYGLEVGVEPRLYEVARSWANNSYTPVISLQSFWRRRDPDVYPDSSDSIPNDELLGEQVLIITEDQGIDVAIQEIHDGHSVALIGLPDGYATAAALLAA